MEEYPAESTLTGPFPVFAAPQAVSWFGTSGSAYAAAVTDYWGNVASQSLSFTVYKGSSNVASSGPSSKGFAGFLPLPGTLRDTIMANITGTCGLGSTAQVTSSAELRVIGYGLSSWISLGAQTNSDQGYGYMNPCAEGSCHLESTLIYYEDWNEPESGSCGGGGTYGDEEESCHQEYVYVEQNDLDGYGWYVVWQGYATVCGY
jgi:hypothetical protein